MSTLETNLASLISAIGTDIKSLLSAKGIVSPGIEPIQAIGNTGTAKTVTVSAGTFQTFTLNGNCTFTLAGATSGKASVTTMMITFDATAGRTMTWAGGTFKWLNGSAPAASVASKVLFVTLISVDGGTTWYGSWSGPA